MVSRGYFVCMRQKHVIITWGVTRFASLTQTHLNLCCSARRTLAIPYSQLGVRLFGLFSTKSVLLTFFQESLRKGRRDAQKSTTINTRNVKETGREWCDDWNQASRKFSDYTTGSICNTLGQSYPGTLGKSVLRHEYPSVRIADAKTPISLIQAICYVKRHKSFSKTKN